MSGQESERESVAGRGLGMDAGHGESPAEDLALPRQVGRPLRRYHPQQLGKRGPRPDIDERATSPEVFGPLNERFGFTIDVCALPRNAKCERFFTPEDDGLTQAWSGERVWCNPPYSSIEPWVEKAWAEIVDDGRRYLPGGAELIVMIVPASRTEQGWWQRRVEPHRDHGGRLRVEFMAGRVRFIRAGATEIAPNERPPFGSCLLIWDATAFSSASLRSDPRPSPATGPSPPAPAHTKPSTPPSRKPAR